MPDFEITSPSGKKYRVTAPEGATQDQVLDRVKAQEAPQAAPQAQRSVTDILFGRGGPRFQTFPERSARGLLGVVKNLVESSKVAPAGSHEATKAMVGPAAEAALAFSPMGPESRLARTAVRGARAEIPTQEELATVTKGPGQGYKGGVMDVPLKDHVLPDIQRNITDALHDQHYRDYLAPQTFRAIKELEAIEGRTPTVADIEGVRQILGRVSPQERGAAGVARNKINEYLSEIQPHDTVSGEKVGATLDRIRGNYAALKRSELVTEAAEKGHRAAQSSGMGANLDNALRQQIKRIRNNPKLVRGFSKEEVEQMDKIIKGGKLTNVARLFSRFGPEHPLTGWGMAGIEGLKHGAMLPLVTLGGGHLAQKIAEGSTQKHLRALDESVRARSPLFAEKNVKPTVQSPMNSLPLSAGVRAPMAAGPPQMPQSDVDAYLKGTML